MEKCLPLVRTVDGRRLIYVLGYALQRRQPVDHKGTGILPDTDEHYHDQRRVGIAQPV